MNSGIEMSEDSVKITIWRL